MLRYSDRPGVVGLIGSMLGDSQINIAGMQVSRREPGGEALMVLAIDAEAPADLQTKLADEVGAKVSSVTLLD